jgi:hypothetical protein
MFLSWTPVAFADISGDAPTWDRDEKLLPAYIFVAISVVEIVLLGIVIYKTWSWLMFKLIHCISHGQRCNPIDAARRTSRMQKRADGRRKTKERL